MKTNKLTVSFIKGIAAVCSLWFVVYACMSCMPKDIVISELSPALKQGIKEEYGYIIPENAELFSGVIKKGKDFYIQLFYRVELDGLSGYDAGMEVSELYSLMLDGKTSGEDYGSFGIDGLEAFEEEYNICFALIEACKRVSFSGIAISEPKDGMVFVYIGGYRPDTDWLK